MSCCQRSCSFWCEFSSLCTVEFTGENAHSREFSEDAYRLAAEPKELYIVPGAGHVDLYDRVSLIPFSKLESFFKEYLKK